MLLKVATHGPLFRYERPQKGRYRQFHQLDAEIIGAGEHQLVILDELTYLSTFNWLPIESVVDVLANRPRHVNVIVTGRDAAPELIELADTVTEMREVKHAYQQGIRALRGIDY